MKLVFKLSEKQIQNIHTLIADSTKAYLKVKEEYPFETFITIDGKEILGYTDINGLNTYGWFGDIAGFIRLYNNKEINDIEISYKLGLLTVIGPRNVICTKEYLDKITKALGTCWRVSKPIIYEKEEAEDLFWYETMTQWYKYRSDWSVYIAWFKSMLEQDELVKSFDLRFTEQNNCLKLLKAGKSSEARSHYPKYVDDILSIA